MINNKLKLSMLGGFLILASGTAGNAIQIQNQTHKPDSLGTVPAELSDASDRVTQAKSQLDQAHKQLDAAKAMLRAAEAEYKAAQANKTALSLKNTAQGLADASGLKSAVATTQSSFTPTNITAPLPLSKPTSTQPSNSRDLLDDFNITPLQQQTGDTNNSLQTSEPLQQMH